MTSESILFGIPKWVQKTRVNLCLLGLLLSLYALHVEMSREKDPEYMAMCDIGDSVSCSKVFTSRWGRGFGIFHFFVGKDNLLNQPNSVLGVIFYTMQLAMGQSMTSEATHQLVLWSWMAVAGSLYLALVLIFVLGDFCIVCVSTYIINFALHYINLMRSSGLEGKEKAG